MKHTIHIKRFETSKDTIVFIQVEIDGIFYDVNDYINPKLLKD